MAAERYDAFPSRMSLQLFKAKTKAAVQGHKLLSKKADALKAKQRKLLVEIFNTKLALNKKVKDAIFSHTKATYAAGDFNKEVLAQVNKAKFKLQPIQQNVTGVQLLDFRPIEDVIDGSSSSNLGLARGGEQISACKREFESTLKELVRLGGLQNSFTALDEAIKVTNRRVNALDCVVLPKMKNTVDYIKSELDEQEREDLFRLKKVIENKKKIADLKADELKEAREAYEKQRGYKDTGNALDMYTQQKEDIIVDDIFGENDI